MDFCWLKVVGLDSCGHFFYGEIPVFILADISENFTMVEWNEPRIMIDGLKAISK